MASVDVLPVFIGYDKRESVAYHVCAQSILDHATIPVAFYPLSLDLLRGLYSEVHTDGSNDFIYSRFLVPWMCGFKGRALFVDGDMIVTGDVAELASMQRLDMAVQCVQHDYKTKYPTKYLGAKNEDYPRKNWSSVILWNCSHFLNRNLTPEFVASKSGAYLHRFSWLPDERIGALPKEWNHLTMEYDADPAAKLYHFTVGTPCFSGYEQQEGADKWREVLARVNHSER